MKNKSVNQVIVVLEVNKQGVDVRVFDFSAVKKAEKAFTNLVKKHGAKQEDVESYVEDGYFEFEHGYILLTWQIAEK